MRITWYPTKPGTLVGELRVRRKHGGGRWRFPLHMEAEEAEAAGTVMCEAHIDHTVAVPVDVYAPGALQLGCRSVAVLVFTPESKSHESWRCQ